MPLVPLFLRLGVTPNGLTSSRIVLAPLAVICQQLGGYWLAICLLLLIIADITDALDGWWARYKDGDKVPEDKVTQFGKLFDPAADKIFHMALFVAFVASGWVPFWIIIVFLWRDQLGDLVRGYVSFVSKKAMGALTSGKIKTASQGIVQGVVISLYLVKAIGFDFPAREISLGFMMIAAVIAIYSGVDYGYHGYVKSHEDDDNKKKPVPDSLPV